MNSKVTDNNNSHASIADVRFRITWEEMGKHDDDEDDALLFAKSIKGYMSIFNKPPEKGMVFENGNCDPARIALITYNGIENEFWIDLVFDI